MYLSPFYVLVFEDRIRKKRSSSITYRSKAVIVCAPFSKEKQCVFYLTQLFFGEEPLKIIVRVYI